MNIAFAHDIRTYITKYIIFVVDILLNILSCIYKVSIVFFFYLKNILQKQLKYYNPICFTSLLVIQVYNHIVFVYFKHLVDEKH